MAETSKIKSVMKGRNNRAIKIIIGIIVVAIAGGIFFAANYIFQLREYKKRISDISISEVNLSKIPDGSYMGSYDAKMVAVKVQIDILDHTIKDISIIYHKNERGKIAERIVDEIKSAQSLKVDTIAGATNSSNVILKAVQNALNSGM